MKDQNSNEDTESKRSRSRLRETFLKTSRLTGVQILAVNTPEFYTERQTGLRGSTCTIKFFGPWTGFLTFPPESSSTPCRDQEVLSSLCPKIYHRGLLSHAL